MDSQTALADLIGTLAPAAPPVAPMTSITTALERELPTTAPAGPPCLDPWCANTARSCGHTPDAHMAHHGAAAIIAGQAGREPMLTVAATATAGVILEDLAPEPHLGDPTSPADDDTPPPSTVAEMRHVLQEYEASRPRSLQTALGPSELGTPCQRQIAYKLAGVPRQVVNAPAWAPMQGTAIHTLMEDVLRFHNGQLVEPVWTIEERLQMDAEIGGSGDAYRSDHQMVVDWKYVGSTALRKVKRKTIPVEQLVSPTYRVQAHLYGYGHERAGRPVRWVRLVLLARSHDYDDSAEWTERYQPEIAIKALDRYYATQDLIAALDLANNPALWGVVPAAPSDDACAWCPFRRVGGPADATGCPGNTDQKIDKQLSRLIA